MGKRIAVFGWLVFFAAILGALFRSGPDDPETAALKQANLYQPFLMVMCALIGVGVLLIIREVRKAVKAQRTLDEIRRQRMR
jgi:hypothetical protein